MILKRSLLVIDDEQDICDLIIAAAEIGDWQAKSLHDPTLLDTLDLTEYGLFFLTW